VLVFFLIPLFLGGNLTRDKKQEELVNDYLREVEEDRKNFEAYLEAVERNKRQ